MQTEINELKALIHKIEAGQWVSTTIHDIAAAARALLHKIEGETDGNPDQEIAQGSVAQEAGRAAGGEDSSGKTGAGSEEQKPSAA